MSNIQVSKLTNANVYLNGVSFLGRAEEVTLPDVAAKMVEHKSLGMVGSVELPSGFEKMEARIKWNSMYPDAMKTTSNPFKSASFQVRSSLEVYNSQGRVAEQPVVAYFTGQIKKVPMGAFKQHDNVELESTFTVTYCKLEINGEEILELDVLANIFKVNGQDVLATYRNNIGG